MRRPRPRSAAPRPRLPRRPRRRDRRQRAPAEEWEQTNAAKLDDANLKKGLRLFWFATGKDDGLITTTKATVELFEKHGFKPIFKETPGAHTWLNWRAYLTEFAPLLFQSGQAGRLDRRRRVDRVQGSRFRVQRSGSPLECSCRRATEGASCQL